MELNEVRFLLAIARIASVEQAEQYRELASNGPQPADPVPLEMQQLRAQGYYAAWSDCGKLLERMIRQIDGDPF